MKRHQQSTACAHEDRRIVRRVATQFLDLEFFNLTAYHRYATDGRVDELAMFPHHQEDPEMSPKMTDGYPLNEALWLERLLGIKPKWIWYMQSITEDAEKQIIGPFFSRQ